MSSQDKVIPSGCDLLEESKKITDFLYGKIRLPYPIDFKLDYSNKKDAQYHVFNTHPYLATIFIPPDLRSYQRLFTTVLHEYLHAFLGNLSGVVYRSAVHFDKVGANLLRDEYDAQEEMTVYLLESSLGQWLYDAYIQELSSDDDEITEEREAPDNPTG